MKLSALNGMFFITPLSIKLGYMKKRKNKDYRSQRWLTILRKRHFPDRVDAYALAEIVKECTRPVQARARQDPTREEGREHRVPPLDK